MILNSILTRRRVLRILHAQLGQSRVVIRPATQWPMKESLLFFDGKIVDTAVPDSRQARVIELPILIAVRPMPLSGIVVRLIGEPHSDPVPIERPELFDETVVELRGPLPFEKSKDFGTPMKELGTVAPEAVSCVTKRDSVWVA